MSGPMVEVDRVARRFGPREVLRDVSLAVPVGRIVGLLGPSGSGKTTLVRMIAGADRPSRGAVAVDGIAMPSLAVLPRVGYMAQSDALYGELTGRANLEFFGALFELRRARLTEAISRVARLVDLAEHLDRPVQLYSGGMKRRLSLAISLLHQPRVLILDEPTVGIDPVLRVAVWDELRAIADGGVAILVTTHVMDEVERCDAVVMIRDGVVLADDSPAALKQRHQVATMEEVFLRCAHPEASS